MRSTEHMIREELQREVEQLPIPNDMWRQIDRRLDERPRLAPQQARSHFPQWRAIVTVAAAGVFWLSVVPASRLADERTVGRSAVLQSQIAIVGDRPADSGPERKGTGASPFQPGGGAATATTGSRLPSLAQ